MLVGTIKYFNSSKQRNEVYNIKAVDSASSFQAFIEAQSLNSLDFLDNEDESAGSMTRRFNVNISTVKIETRLIWNDIKGKEIPKPVNHNFFLTIGSAIRYAKSHCYKRNAIGYTGFKLSTGEYVPETETTYKIPCGLNNEECLGEVRLRLGEISGIHISTPTYSIDLDDDTSIETLRFYDIKTAINKGFKFDEEHLKFKIEQPKVSTEAVYGIYTSLDDIIKNNPNKEYSWLLGRKYYIVDDDTIEDVCEKIKNHKGLVAFDTETTGLDITFKSRIGQGDQLVGVVLTINVGESYYFPLQHKRIKNLANGDHWYVMTHYLKEILESKELIAHNMSFDWKVGYIYDINANIVHDTMAIFKLTIGAEIEDFRVNLKQLASNFLHRDSLELSDLVVDDSWGESDITFADLPYDLVKLYACADTDNTLELFLYAMSADLLHKYNAQRVYKIEIAFSFAVAYQEFYGHKIDTDNVDILKDKVEKGIEKYKKKLFDIVGYEFNPSSSPQLLRIMYNELGIPVQYDRQSGKPTTGKDALQFLSEIEDINGNSMYPFVKFLQKYREYDGIRKNFIKTLPELATTDGYLFPDVQQYGTTTGRVSIKKPNYQSYNNVVKQHIIPRPGFYGTDNDYSSIEYRILGSMAGQEELIYAFADPELDYHSYQASRMFNVPYEAVTSKLRKSAKGINFGLPYGMGDKSLGVRIFGEESKENTRKAGVLRAKYFQGQEKIERFFEDKRDGGVSNGYTETYYGRRRYYHKNKFSISAIRRQAGNQVIQGTAADIYKLAVGRLFLRVCQEGWLGKVMFTAFVHDEIFCEVSESIDPIVWMKAVRECFEVEIDGFCPLYVGFGFGTTWYEAKSVEIPTKLQTEMCNQWGESGYPDWTGDSRAFCDTVPKLIRNYEIRAIKESITSKDNQGKTIKPMINTYLTEAVVGDKKFAKGVYKSILVEKGIFSKEEVEELSDDILIENILKCYGVSDLNDIPELVERFKERELNGCVVDLNTKDDLQGKLDYFCEYYGVDRSIVDQKSSSDISSNDDDKFSGSVLESQGEDFGLDDAEKEAELEKLRNSRIEEYGLYADFYNERITIKLINNKVLMDLLRSKMSTSNNGYQVYIKDCENDKLYATAMYCEPSEVSKLQELYFAYFKQVNMYKTLEKV